MMASAITFSAKLPFNIEKKGEWYISSCPVLDVYSQGRTEKKAKENLIEAVSLFFMSCIERNTIDDVLRECGTWSLYTQIQHIDERISEMFECLQQIRLELSQRPLSSTILIHDLGNKSLKVVRPISVVLNETDEESLARWPETRASGIGNTLAEAIASLKKNIIDLFEDLNSRNFESLGSPAIDTLRILNTHIRIDK